MKLFKRFTEWIRLKEKIHNNTSKPPLFKEGEIWWCSIGENVGSEINGKSELFSRPILVYKKLSKTQCMGIPTTSQFREGSWYVPVEYGKYKVTVILAQARVIDVKRFSTKLGKLDSYEYKKVRSAFLHLYK